jgi:hypothetical protein
MLRTQRKAQTSKKEIKGKWYVADMGLKGNDHAAHCLVLGRLLLLACCNDESILRV